VGGGTGAPVGAAFADFAGVAISSPVRALTHSPLAAGGQSLRAQLGPFGAAPGTTPISVKNFAHSGLTEAGSAS